MRYFPVLLDIQKKRCLVVGAGNVACRKAASLRRAGARVTVVGAQPGAQMRRLCRSAGCALVQRPYRRADIRRAVLVIAATDDPAVNGRVARDAASLGIPVNVVDDPANCSFIVPAVAQKNGLIIAVSTSGKAPSLSKRIRQDMLRLMDAHYLPLLRKVAAARCRLKLAGVGFSRRKKLLTRLACAGRKAGGR